MDALVDAAREAVPEAHVPYSDYAVGAAIRAADGSVYVGCNVENANLSNTLHAEEVALGAAVTDGVHAFDALAVSSADRDGVTPCGRCRQSLAEFCDDAFPVACDHGEEVRTYELGELLPASRLAENLRR